MSDVVFKGVSKVWSRIFDHKGFLSGEISFILREFEEKRKDEEVDNLFKTIECITEIKDTEIEQFKQAGKQLEHINERLDQVLCLSDKFCELEEKYKQDNTLEDNRKGRKVVWDKFMDEITTKYSDINTEYERKEEELAKPSKKLKEYINDIKVFDDLPDGISNIIFRNKPKKLNKPPPPKIHQLLKEEDEKFIKSVTKDIDTKAITQLPLNKTSTVNPSDKLLSLEDIHWIYNHIQKQNQTNDKIWLHELLEGSDIVLPKNEEIPRNEELDKRCKILKEQQANRDYFKMTKNVDTRRRVLPEDTIGYQLKQMNRHLVAVFQFIMSVIAGFVFGFIGIELLIGNLDFGFRLLLGIICALTIALAELYFLAKKLNEDLQIEYTSEKPKTLKLD
ncbi:unnamed protein product [Phyllotreta striolata]|uniref:Biogenesis of lysosome-related organelles complex 1 subunit 5 n=1 Tax=Phyllotreta striolata TaxID=444603 RepID=A0A9N9TFZ0_PHYSR|nr:unnamed protein product [Phyllotreta striolata]